MRKQFRKIVPLAGLVILIAVFSLTTDGKFTSANNIRSIIMQSAIVLVAAVGTVFVMAHNNLDFSLGGACAFSSVAAYLISGGNMYLFFILCIVFGVLCGLLTSLIHIKGRVPAFMAGMCIMFAGRGIAQTAVASRSMLLVSATKLNNLWVFIAIIAVVFTIGFILFNYTKIGKYQKLIGTNPKAAELSGISISKYKMLAFIISGVTVGIAAWLTIIRSGSVSANTGLNLEIDVLLALSLGGIPMSGGSATKMRSVFIGTLIYFILNNGLTLWGLNANYVDIVKAAFFLFTVTISIDRSQKTLIE